METLVIVYLVIGFIHMLSVAVNVGSANSIEAKSASYFPILIIMIAIFHVIAWPFTMFLFFQRRTHL